MMNLLILAVLAVQDGDPDAALKTFKAAYRSKDVAARAAAVAELAKTDHRKVRAQLARLLTADLPEVRVAAAKGLTLSAEDRPVTARVLAAALRPNAKLPAVVVALLDALGAVGDPAGLRGIHPLFSDHDLMKAKASVAAAVKIKHGSSIPPLIDLLRRIEGIEKSGNGTNDIPNVGGGNQGAGRYVTNSADDRKLARELGPMVRDGLKAIAGTTCVDAEQWKAWWRQNAGRFR